MKHRCVIVGAGIIGAALAARLADADAAVTVVEADQPGRGTSGSSLANSSTYASASPRTGRSASGAGHEDCCVMRGILPPSSRSRTRTPADRRNGNAGR